MAITRFRFKVKPRKDPLVVNCAPELTTLLACFASTGDMRSTEACANAAKSLHTCIAGKPKISPKPQKSSINYLLSRIK